MRSLIDVYKSYCGQDSAETGESALVFLYRDLTSDFDCIGPHFLFAKCANANVLWILTFEAMRLFHRNGLETYALIFDSATTNMKMVKAVLAGLQGPFGVYYSFQSFLDDWFYAMHPMASIIRTIRGLNSMLA